MANLVKYLIVASLIAQFGGNVMADEFAKPTRMFGLKAVNLMPLFKWWKEPPTNAPGTINAPWGTKAASIWQTNRMASRPLTAWKLIRGKVLEVRPYAFVVDAKVFTSSNDFKQEKIYLYRAPIDEKNQFEELKRQQAQLQAQSSGVYNQLLFASENRDNAQNKQNLAAFMQQNSSPATARQIQGNIDNYGNSATRYENQASSARGSLDELNREMNGIKEALKAFPKGDTYTVAWFAMETGTVVDGMPVYDCGKAY